VTSSTSFQIFMILLGLMVLDTYGFHVWWFIIDRCPRQIDYIYYIYHNTYKTLVTKDNQLMMSHNNQR
jgi:hypothetical protein